MAIAFVADGGYNSGTTSVALTVPAGVSANDSMWAGVTAKSKTSGGNTVTAPSGWNAVTHTGDVSDSSSFFNNLFIFFKIASSSEPASYTFTMPASTSPGIDGNIRDYTGTRYIGNPVNALAALGNPNAASLTLAAVVETFFQGELYVVFSRNDIGAAFTSSSPALSHTFYNAGAAGLNAYEIGDLVPLAAPGAESITWATAASIASIGVTILPSDILQAQACL